MALFDHEYDMIIELERLELLMPKYSEQLKFLCKIIRNQIWEKSSEILLARSLNVYNILFSMLIRAFGENLGFIEIYTDLLCKKSYKYTKNNITNEFNTIYENIIQWKTQEIVKEHWKQLNPYFKNSYKKEDLLKKDLIEILDDFFNNILDICPDHFLIEIGDLSHLLRGRKGTWFTESDLMPPTIEIATKLNIINRWNPPSKRYVYLVNGNDENSERICLEEIRIKPDVDVTVGNILISSRARNKKILNLDYSEISREQIHSILDETRNKNVSDILDEIFTEEIKPTEENVDMLIKKRNEKSRIAVASYCGELLMKEICDAIFEPLDKEDVDNYLKDRCYKSFHILAEYLERKGISGIKYPSTRMKLIQKTGSNIVLFNAMDVNPDKTTYRVLRK